MTSNKRRVDVRRDEILRQLRAEGMVSVARLAKELDVTHVTIRTDLSALEREGHLVRVQGGAVLPVRTGGAPSNVAEGVSCLAEKEEIARCVCDLIQNGDTLFINSGTTTKCVAQALCEKKDLNVVTNSLAVATVLGGNPTVHVVLLGGEINAQYGFTYGGDTQEQLSRYQADWVILSCEGISGKNGITTHHVEEAIIDRLMISGAKRVLLATDHTKIGHVGFARVCECDESFTLVTDRGAQAQALRELNEHGLQILQAKQ